MLFGMLGSRAMALTRLERFDEAAEWGVKAAARPNAHAHIKAIAAYTLALAGRTEEGRVHLASVHQALPGYSAKDLVATMQLDAARTSLFHKAAKLLGTK